MCISPNMKVPDNKVPDNWRVSAGASHNCNPFHANGLIAHDFS